MVAAPAAPAYADASDALRVAAQLGPGHGVAAVLLRMLLLVATAVVAGAGLAGAVAGTSRPLGRVAATAAAAVTVGAVLARLDGATTVAGTLVQSGLAVAVAVLLGHRLVAVPAVLLSALLALELGSAHAGAAFVLDAAYAVAATVLVALSLAALPRPAPPADPDAAVLPTVPDEPGARCLGGIGLLDLPAGPARGRVADRGSAPAGGRPAVPIAPLSGLAARVSSVALPGAVAVAVPPDTRTRLAPPAPARARTRAEIRDDLLGARATGSDEASRLPQHRAAGRRHDPRAARPTAAGRLRRNGLYGGALVALLGVAQLLLTGPATLHDLTATPYGLASIAGIVLPALAAGCWAATGRAAGAVRAGELHRFAAAATVLGLTAVTTLAALPTPAPAAHPGEPLLRAVDVGGAQLAVLVAPMRPGPNLVHVSGSDYPDTGAAPAPRQAPAGHHGGAPTGPAGLTVEVGDVSVPVTARPGAAGGWAVVDLPAGTDRIVLRAGPVDGVVPVDVGDRPGAADTTLAGADGPECASALLGGFVAARGDGPAGLPACPSQVLTAADALALRATVGFLGDHGVPRVALVADDSPRSRAAADLVRDEARRRHLPVADGPSPDGALLVVAGWGGAVDTVHDATRRATGAPTYLGGIFLAPWLLTPGVVSQAQSTVLPLDFGPQDAGPQQYAAVLAATFPGSGPSTSGYLAWLAATRGTTDDRPRLYGAAAVNVPMGGPMDDMVHGGSPWFPGGTVVPVTGQLAGT